MSRWWFRWRDVLTRLVTLGASITAFLGLSLPHIPRIQHQPWWGVALAVVSIIALAAVIVMEVQSVRNRRVLKLTDGNGIKKYMHDWISYGGRVAIWSRDMSWAQNPESRALLEKKARDGELIICLPESIPLTDDLQKLGAEICAYGRGGSAPASRFTIRFYERDGARVAVGRSLMQNHLIDEFDSGEHPAFYLAEDLVQLARNACNDRA